MHLKKRYILFARSGRLAAPTRLCQRDLHSIGGINVTPAEELAWQSGGLADRSIPVGEQRSYSEFVRTFAYPAYSLRLWEEALGQLKRIWEENGLLKALIGKIVLILPLELEETLKPLLDREIGILRTDLANKEFLVRVQADGSA